MTGRARRGMRPGLDAACRASLREVIPSGAGSVSDEAASHLRSCAVCRARLHASARISAWLAGAARPEVPDELTGRAAETLASVCERVVERAEGGALGRWVHDGAVAIPDTATIPGAVSDSVVGQSARLASRLVAEPIPLESAVWSRVRRSILEAVAEEAAATDLVAADSAGSGVASRDRGSAGLIAAGPSGSAMAPGGIRSVEPGWKLLIVGAAASVAIGFLAVSSGADVVKGPVSEAHFVIIDLGRAPDIDFAVARYGLRH